MLNAIGVQSIAHCDDQQKSIILQAVNKGVQNLSAQAPLSFWGMEPFTAALRAPESVTLKVEGDDFDEVDVAESTGLEQRHYGQQLVITGYAGETNSIITVGTKTKLRIPLDAAGTFAATVSYNMAKMPVYFRRLVGTTVKVGTEERAIVHRALQSGESFVRLRQTSMGDGSKVFAIELSSAASARTTVSGECFVMPARIDAISDTRDDLCPVNCVESVLVPFCLDALTSLSPDTSIKMEATRGAMQMASAILSEMTDAETTGGCELESGME